MTTTHYLWDEENDSYFMETDGDGNVTAVYTNEPVPYGRVISQRRGNATSFYHYDGQGSTRQLTDESGNVTDEYTYSAFGETVASSGTTINPFGYKGALGYYGNPESNDIYVRARPLVSNTARWLTVDPWSYHDGMNFYRFVRNNPGNLWDPSGFGSCSAQHCSQQFAGPLEGAFLFSAKISGIRCGGDAKARFRLVDSKYTPGIFRRNKKGQIVECGLPANDEAESASASGWNWRYGNITKRECSKPVFHGTKDSHGCWILTWEWECEIDCLEDGKCAPPQFSLGIYGPPGSGLDAFGLKVFANASYDEACCMLNSCSIEIEAGWYYNESRSKQGYPDLFEPAPSNCTPAQKAQMGVTP